MKKIEILSGCIILFLFLSCSFDYGENEFSGEEQPGLIMENVEYVRVRSADPKARFQAERAERYENQGVMRIQNLTFEQYGSHGSEVNAHGSAGYASVQIDSGDIYMDKNVRIDATTEDIIIETYQLEWRDKPHVLSTPEENEVNISKENGTSFTGTGLYVETRSRQFEFKSYVNGLFIHEDSSEKTGGETIDEAKSLEDNS